MLEIWFYFSRWLSVLVSKRQFIAELFSFLYKSYVSYLLKVSHSPSLNFDKFLHYTCLYFYKAAANMAGSCAYQFVFFTTLSIAILWKIIYVFAIVVFAQYVFSGHSFFFFWKLSKHIRNHLNYDSKDDLLTTKKKKIRFTDIQSMIFIFFPFFFFCKFSKHIRNHLAIAVLYSPILRSTLFLFIFFFFLFCKFSKHIRNDLKYDSKDGLLTTKKKKVY